MIPWYLDVGCTHGCKPSLKGVSQSFSLDSCLHKKTYEQFFSVYFNLSYEILILTSAENENDTCCWDTESCDGNRRFRFSSSSKMLLL